jgi:hypothetical protein
MATKVEISKVKHPKIVLIDKKHEIEKSNKSLVKILYVILLALIVLLILELTFLLFKF